MEYQNWFFFENLELKLKINWKLSIFCDIFSLRIIISYNQIVSYQICHVNGDNKVI